MSEQQFSVHVYPCNENNWRVHTLERIGVHAYIENKDTVMNSGGEGDILRPSFWVECGRKKQRGGVRGGGDDDDDDGDGDLDDDDDGNAQAVLYFH